MKPARFVIFEDARGLHRWSLRTANGRVIADSGEGYTRRHDCVLAVVAVKDTMRTARTVFVQKRASHRQLVDREKQRRASARRSRC